MANLECNKCHKPLSKGKKCDACRQKEKDSMKAIGKGVLAIGGLVLTSLPVIKKFKK